MPPDRKFWFFGKRPDDSATAQSGFLEASPPLRPLPIPSETQIAAAYKSRAGISLEKAAHDVWHHPLRGLANSGISGLDQFIREKVDGFVVEYVRLTQEKTKPEIPTADFFFFVARSMAKNKISQREGLQLIEVAVESIKDAPTGEMLLIQIQNQDRRRRQRTLNDEQKQILLWTIFLAQSEIGAQIGAITSDAIVVSDTKALVDDVEKLVKKEFAPRQDVVVRRFSIERPLHSEQMMGTARDMENAIEKTAAAETNLSGDIFVPSRGLLVPGSEAVVLIPEQIMRPQLWNRAQEAYKQKNIPGVVEVFAADLYKTAKEHPKRTAAIGAAALITTGVIVTGAELLRRRRNRSR